MDFIFKEKKTFCHKSVLKPAHNFSGNPKFKNNFKKKRQKTVIFEIFFFKILHFMSYLCKNYTNDFFSPVKYLKFSKIIFMKCFQNLKNLDYKTNGECFSPPPALFSTSVYFGNVLKCFRFFFQNLIFCTLCTEILKIFFHRSNTLKFLKNSFYQIYVKHFTTMP